MAWRGADIKDDTAWQYPLDDRAITEIAQAVEAARRQGGRWQSITPTSFPLPTLDGLFAEIANQLEDGLGMARLEGLPVGDFSLDELRMVLWGLSQRLGTPVFQTARGEIMGEIADEGANVGKHRGQVKDPETGKMFLSSRSRAQSTAALRWHTDRCDIVGLLCVNQARRGGTSRLASSVTVSNTMLERHPELAKTLWASVPRSRLGEETGGESCFYLLPVFAEHDGKFSSHYSRTFVEAAQKNPLLTEFQPEAWDRTWEALDCLADTADEVGFEMDLRPGDVQFLNNHVIYHGRTPFEDHDEPDRKRRLLRVWLSGHNARTLPPGFEVLWGNTDGRALRGGMCQSPLPGPGLQSSSSAPTERVPAYFL